MSAARTGRNIFLDYVRGIACILIVLYHYTQRYNELFQNSGDWKFRVPWGYMAISTFFMLSGYLAIINDDSKTGLWTYIKKRAIRLFPAYWVAIPITFITTHFLLTSRRVSLIVALFNFTMLESFVGIPLVDGAYWTLANELVFYFFVAIVVVLLKKRNTLPIFGLGWILLLFIYHFVKSDSLFCAAIGKLIAKQYGHMFVAGTSLVFFLKETRNKWITIVSAICILLAVVYQYLTFGLDYTMFFLISLLVIVVCIIVDKRGLVPNDIFRKLLKPLEITATISYPFYLLHQNIGYAIMENLRPIITEKEWIIIIPILTVFALAYLVHKFIEIPIADFLRKKYCA